MDATQMKFDFSCFFYKFHFFWVSAAKPVARLSDHLVLLSFIMLLLLLFDWRAHWKSGSMNCPT